MKFINRIIIIFNYIIFSFEYKYEDNYFHKKFENIVDLDDTSDFLTYSLYNNILSTILSVTNKLKTLYIKFN